MTPPRPDDDREDLPPTEAARARRRDHDAAAGARSGMRTGLAKQFKQVLDAQTRRARRTTAPPPEQGEDGADETPDVAPKKRRHGHDTARHP